MSLTAVSARQALLDAERPEFPSSGAVARSLDSDDSDDSSEELRLAEQRAGVTYQDVLQVSAGRTADSQA